MRASRTGIRGLSGPSSSVPGINALASAVSVAEGYGVSGALPTRNNNPGDLESGGSVTSYPDPQSGWDALTGQLEAIVNGTSSVYSPNMTLAQVGNIYAGGDPNWAANVAQQLGVSTDTPIGSLAGGGAGAAPVDSGILASVTNIIDDWPDGASSGGFSATEIGLLVAAGILVVWLAESLFD
jgi:hypothetical protein